jgi:hypothetical protein
MLFCGAREVDSFGDACQEDAPTEDNAAPAAADATEDTEEEVPANASSLDMLREKLRVRFLNQTPLEPTRKQGR